jgi:hypothetical protein
MPLLQEVRGNPIGHFVKICSIIMVDILKKSTPGSVPKALRNIHLATLPSWSRLNYYLTTAPSFVLIVAGQF